MTVTKAMLMRKKPAMDEILIPVNEDQQLELNAAKTSLELTLLGTQDEEESAKAKARLEAAREAIRKDGVAFTLTAVGRVRYDQILLEHPATDTQKAEDADKPEGERRSYNPDTLWPALLAESVRDSKLGSADWDELVFRNKEWNAQELEDLRTRLGRVNNTSLVVELGN
jgi:hypothetical protein